MARAVSAQSDRAIAILKASLPGVPAVAEDYPSVDLSLWHGFLTTGGTPAAAIDILNHAIVATLQTPDIREALIRNGAEIVGNSPAEFRSVFAADVEKTAQLVRMSGATAN